MKRQPKEDKSDKWVCVHLHEWARIWWMCWDLARLKCFSFVGKSFICCRFCVLLCCVRALARVWWIYDDEGAAFVSFPEFTAGFNEIEMLCHPDPKKGRERAHTENIRFVWNCDGFQMSSVDAMKCDWFFIYFLIAVSEFRDWFFIDEIWIEPIESVMDIFKIKNKAT